MEIITEHAIRLLRDKDLSFLDEQSRLEVLSFYIDDNEPPSKDGRVILAMNILAVSMSFQESKLHGMSMDILLSADKISIIDTLNCIQIFLLEIVPE